MITSLDVNPFRQLDCVVRCAKKEDATNATSSCVNYVLSVVYLYSALLLFFNLELRKFACESIRVFFKGTGTTRTAEINFFTFVDNDVLGQQFFATYWTYRLQRKTFGDVSINKGNLIFCLFCFAFAVVAAKRHLGTIYFNRCAGINFSTRERTGNLHDLLGNG